MARNIKFDNVNITGGFWGKLQRRNRDVTIPAVYDRFTETGRIDAFAQTWKEGDPCKPHVFWDSDVAKWMEAAAYSLQKEPDSKLEAHVEEIIDRIEKNQDADGYFNIYFQTIEPDKRWTNRNCHELYSAGHLMEAAVAWADTTGHDRFLRCMCKYADYIEKVFMIERSAAFTSPGHEEIELALVKLWKKTGEERYLKLAEFFINERGTKNITDVDHSQVLDGSRNIQDHLPVREQNEAVGHAVRACYLYAAMADIASARGDRDIKSACEKIWKNIVTRRMFITGSIGQSRVGEAFSVDYDLPNKSAYAETCAAIALAFFALRMNELEPNGEYGDIVERILYNGFLAATNTKGDAFFYENPLEIDLEAFRSLDVVGSHEGHPIAERGPIFWCACCPPNITRFMAQLGNFIYTTDDNTVYINQYMDSTVSFDGIKLTQSTSYPHEGRVTVQTEGLDGKRLALRLPGWCRNFSVEVDGLPENITPENGWLIVSGKKQMTVVLDMDMPVTPVSANPKVHEDAGRVAMMRGPIVYCLEAVDNGEDLRDIALIPDSKTELSYDDNFGAYCINTCGTRSSTVSDALYAPYTGLRTPTRLHFIPYYGFGNRGASDMLVWVDIKPV